MVDVNEFLVKSNLKCVKKLVNSGPYYIFRSDLTVFAVDCLRNCSFFKVC